MLIGELVPMDILVSLNSSLVQITRWGISSVLLYVCLVVTRAFHNQLKHWSIKCYIVHRVFMLFASLPWVSMYGWFLMSSYVVDSPFDLGLKLSTRRRCYRYFNILGMPLDLWSSLIYIWNFYNHIVIFITKLWGLS